MVCLSCIIKPGTRSLAQSLASFLRQRGKTGSFTVYNLWVDSFHTFYVSRNDILVHNGSPCPVSFQSLGGIFGGDWISKKIHANVDLGKKTTEISFRLSADGSKIEPRLVFSNLKAKEARDALEYGELFLENPENRATLLNIAKKALTNDRTTDVDRTELNKMIEILETVTPQKTGN